MKVRMYAVLMPVMFLAAEASLMAAGHPVLPSDDNVKTLLNTTKRHREWISVPVAGDIVLAFVVYPERSDKAPVVLLTADKQGASDWIRAVAGQVAAEGFIAVVPDVLSGKGPRGGDTNSFANSDAVAHALRRLGSEEIARRRPPASARPAFRQRTSVPSNFLTTGFEQTAA